MNAIKKAISSNKGDSGLSNSRGSVEDGTSASRRNVSGASAINTQGSGRESGYSTERVPGSPTTPGGGISSSTDDLQAPNGRSSMNLPRGRPSGDFQRPHSMGHDASNQISSAFDPKSASHRHTHLAHKMHETVHEHETEEVQRLKTHERHITHVQHHVQPIHDTEHLPEVHHERNIPQTHIEERHISTDDDLKAFQSLNIHQDQQMQAPKQRQVVDLGEKVNEVVHHHVHNIVQPILVKDTHQHHRIHTVIPSHHITHEAPIVHQSIEHPAISKADFLKQGGSLESTVGHGNVDALFTGECTRKVNGVGEDLARELKLKPSALSSHDHHEELADEPAAMASHSGDLSSNAAAHVGGPTRV